MLYLLRDKHGSIDYARVTVVTPQGIARYLPAEGWVVEVLETWRSPETDAEYPIGWRIEAPTEDLSLFVKAEFAHQENVSRLIPSLFYWEGSVVVTDADGRRLGIGYVELTGYGTAAPPLI
jgi:predicted secreted hydrolase